MCVFVGRLLWCALKKWKRDSVRGQVRFDFIFDVDVALYFKYIVLDCSVLV